MRLAVRHRGGVRSTSGSGVPRGEPVKQKGKTHRYIRIWYLTQGQEMNTPE